MKQKWAQVTGFLKQYIIPYTPAILIIAFVVWHLFGAENSYLDICENDRKIRALEQEIASEKETMEQLREDITNSNSDSLTIDRIAREKHGMQRAHEDVYILVDNTPDSISQ